MTRPAVGSSWGTNCARRAPRAKLAAGLQGAPTRMAHPLTLARRGTDDEDGAPTDPGTMGPRVLTMLIELPPTLTRREY